MPDFLTRRCGTWHFVRRVPVEFAHLDERGIIKHSTKVRIGQDRTGRRAARVASKLNDELELYWKSLIDGRPKGDLNGYDEARRRARSLGFEYIENAQLLMLPPEHRLDRVETLVARGATNDAVARAALLGTVKRPAFPLSMLFEEYEAMTKDEVKDFSRNQLRVWRNSRMRAVENFVSVVGDKPVNELTVDDAIDYSEWWRDRVINDDVAVKSANKDIGQLSRMLKDISIRRRLNIPEIFKDWNIVDFDTGAGSVKPERSYKKWPVADGDVMTSPRDACIMIDNHHLQERLILDHTDVNHPRRTVIALPDRGCLCPLPDRCISPRDR